MPVVPLQVKRPALRVPGQRALYDFAWSDTIDLSGNGYHLSRPSAPVRDSYIEARAVRGTSDDIYDAGTSLIGDSDYPLIWAWVYIRDFSGVTRVFGRGQDGYGSGWSIGIEINTSKVLSASIVLVNPITLQWTATLTPAWRPGWNFIAGLVQNNYGAEPSHVSAIWESQQGRTGLTGHTQLRGSTVGSYVGASASKGTSASRNVIGALGVELVNSMTEAQALAEVQLIRRRTESAFR